MAKKEKIRKLELSADKELDKWEYSLEGIRYRFAGYYDFGSEKQEILFFVALSKLPKEIIDFSEKIFFISGNLKGDGAQGLLIGNREYLGVVHLQPRFWESSLRRIVDGVAHEIAHMYLKHRFDADMSKEIDKKMELEADELAGKWLNRKVAIGQKRFKQKYNEPT